MIAVKLDFLFLAGNLEGQQLVKGRALEFTVPGCFKSAYTAAAVKFAGLLHPVSKAFSFGG